MSPLCLPYLRLEEEYSAPLDVVLERDPPPG
jgi:hypothetical protein